MFLKLANWGTVAVTDYFEYGFRRTGGGHHYDPNQPRVPAGDPSHHGGRWTRVGGTGPVSGSGTAASATSGASGASASAVPKGVEVVLPNAWRVVDSYKPTAFLRSPIADLSPVAAAGRGTGETYSRLLSLALPEAGTAATFYFVSRFMSHVGTGGIFDYQRSGNQVLGLLGIVPFVQLREFRNVANFNVGLFCQQAGLSLDEALSTSGLYASLFSANYRPNEPYGLDSQTRAFVASGFAIGQSGVFDQQVGRTQ